jgi:hypothetical protein
MPSIDEVAAELQGVGISEHDALVIADCIVKKKSCSWVNTDPVDEKVLRDLYHLVQKQNYGIKVEVTPIPTRSKFIWEVKIE